jgi:TatD DNase family protein
LFWFDTHLHVSQEDDFDAIVAAAQAAGVGGLLIQGTSMEDCVPTAALADSRRGIFAAVGLHPHVAAAGADLALIRDLLSRPAVVAVGEIGLDYHYNFSPPERQREVFAMFLELASELSRPAVIHCRDAYADCRQMVADHLRPGAPFIIHSFTGTPDEAGEWLAMGAMLSMNGMVTFNKAVNIRESLAVIPLSRLLLETDSPYLAPVPHRGRTNCPAFLPLIGKRVAREKGVTEVELAAVTTANACQLLNVELPAIGPQV